MFIVASAPAEVNPTPAAVIAAEDATPILDLDADDFPDYSDEEWEARAEAAYAMDRVCSGPIL
jgi:hypothetical protein